MYDMYVNVICEWVWVGDMMWQDLTCAPYVLPHSHYVLIWLIWSAYDSCDTHVILICPHRSAPSARSARSARSRPPGVKKACWRKSLRWDHGRIPRNGRKRHENDKGSRMAPITVIQRWLKMFEHVWTWRNLLAYLLNILGIIIAAWSLAKISPQNRAT